MPTIKIEGEIGRDVTAKDVREGLKSAGKKRVTVEIASPGGYLSEGLIIYNELKNHKGGVDTHLTGLVASMATYIAMVGEKRTAEKNSVFMIHNGSAFAMGDHRRMFKVGKTLNSLTNVIAKEYSEKTDTDLKDIRSAMDDETYYFGDEIAEAGFVHEVVGNSEPEDKEEAIALAELKVEECESKMSDPKAIKKDMLALATMFKDEAPQGAKHKPQEDDKVEITLVLLEEKAPELLKQLRTDAKVAGYDEGLSKGAEDERARVTSLLDIEDADADVKAKAIKEGLNVDSAYRLLFEAEKTAKAEALKKLEESKPGSVGQQGKDTDTEDGDTFMTVVDAYQKEHKCTRTAALTAVQKSDPDLHAAFLDNSKKED